MESLIVSAMIALIVLVGLYLASKQRKKKTLTMTSPEWKTKQRAFQAEQRGRGIG